jgi:hypothetical protein
MLSSLSELNMEPESVDEAEELEEDPRQSEPRISDQSSLLSEVPDASELAKELGEESPESESEVMSMDKMSNVGSADPRAVSSSLSSGDKPARAKTRLDFFFQRKTFLIRVVWWSKKVLSTSRVRRWRNERQGMSVKRGVSERSRCVMIWHLQTLFKLFHGGFIPYANRLFHKPKPHPPGFFHNSCGHNNTGQINSITPIGLFNNPSFQPFGTYRDKNPWSTERIGTHPCFLIETPTYSKHTLSADSSIDRLLGKYNI